MTKVGWISFGSHDALEQLVDAACRGSASRSRRRARPRDRASAFAASASTALLDVHAVISRSASCMRTRANGGAKSIVARRRRRSSCCRTASARHVASNSSVSVHHVVVVGVGLVELQHRELGVVRAVDALVAEVRPISKTRSKPPTISRLRYSSSAMRRYSGMSSALWCVTNGRAAAPPYTAAAPASRPR